MGVIAVVRQTFFDAQFQAADARALCRPSERSRPRPALDDSLEALQPAARKTMPVLFEPGGMLMVDRAMQLSRELGLQPVMLATGQEWRRPDLARAAAVPFIVPVDFPEAAKLPEDDDWLAVPYEQLRAWDHAPGNPALLRREGLDIALTTHGLGKEEQLPRQCPPRHRARPERKRCARRADHGARAHLRRRGSARRPSSPESSRI